MITIIIKIIIIIIIVINKHISHYTVIKRGFVLAHIISCYFCSHMITGSPPPPEQTEFSVPNVFSRWIVGNYVSHYLPACGSEFTAMQTFVTLMCVFDLAYTSIEQFY